MKTYTVAAIYKFISLDDYQSIRQPLLDICLANGVKGTLLLAAEGINGTIAGFSTDIDTVLDYLGQNPRFVDLELKKSTAEQMPFLRMKVKLKKEIVTMGVPDVSPTKQVGTYVAPEQWNELISDPDVIVLDTRNDYEVSIGTFKNAINPETNNFREFPAYVKKNLTAEDKNKKIAMFCTGGIRCEKASSYMLSQGFKEVYHIKGGILKYLENIPKEKSLWQGECFVFDSRVAVKENVKQGSYDQCYGCRYPITEADKGSPCYEPGICCPRCYADITPEQRSRFEERHKQVQLARTRKVEHIGR